MNKSLVAKYNVQGPRYTSYPTVPYWDQSNFSTFNWKESLLQSYVESNEKEGLSIYIHLPFCEQLCTFCACHKRITKQHSFEQPYIQSLLKEWQLYLNLFKSVNDEVPKIRELHLGGGTPTFFSVENLQYLLEELFKTCELTNEVEFSFEGHPKNTSFEHLKMLFSFGFRRVSFGVQDYDEHVQKAINRIQPFEEVEKVTNWAREIGYTSVSHDLVYGLPFQTWDTVQHTIEKTLQLKPDRLAFYSYAHVPWIKGVGQRGFNEDDLPHGDVKRLLYENGKELFEKLGYVEIGMDHFSLPNDDLCQSMKNGKLHRNFMGYSSSKTQIMIGLGMSAISDSWYAFAQNEKSLEEYQDRIARNELPVVKGHILSDEDLVVRKHILELMCQLETNFDHTDYKMYEGVRQRLSELIDDDLVLLQDGKLLIKEEGRPFLRNVAMAFDLRMWENVPQGRMFSSTI